MNMPSFLARVVPATGNYLTIAWRGDKGFIHRSFPPADVQSAVNYLHWANNHGWDAYFALAAFNLADAKSNQRGPYLQARRVQANVHSIKCLAMDADVKRAGDKKDPATCFPDRVAAVTWLKAFCKATGMPMPNAGVNSGYGLHWYWILDQAITLAEWQPLADALKQAMLANNWVGDISPTIDSARILRPPETNNYKASTPAPVRYIQAYERPDYTKVQLEQVLAPFVGLQQRQTGTGGTSTLGPRPTYLPPGGLGIGAAASSGLDRRRYSMALIATKCEQVKKSLANHGNGDPYQLWYLNHLSLCAYTDDGRDFIHELGKGDPRYKPDSTEEHFARAEKERDGKAGLGPPLCKSFDANRRGVCPTCPHFGISSPIILGADDGDGDLPDYYRRKNGWIEHRVGSKKDEEWIPVLKGDVSAPTLDMLPHGGYRITFIYTVSGRSFPAAFNDHQLGANADFALFTTQHLAVTRRGYLQTADFIMAWLTKLRDLRAERDVALKPFGWQRNGDGLIIGASIAGDLYRTDGSHEIVPGGDPELLAQFRPMGELANWRKAAALFEGGRPDLQMLIATTFASPLLTLFTEIRGMSLNCWSTLSGVNKTSAVRVAHGVWGNPVKGIQQTDDTWNAAMRSLSEPRFLTRYWDDVSVKSENRDGFSKMIYTIPMGREKARLNSNITMREPGEWESLLVMTANSSHADQVQQNNEGTDSGMLRLLEINMQQVKQPLSGAASQTLKLLETNYGHAGRTYLQWLVQNLDTAKTHLTTIHDALVKTLGSASEQRFYVAAATSIITGAIIARKLGLFDFDVKGINQVLREAIAASCDANSNGNYLNASGQLDTVQLISRYVLECGTNGILRTNVFSTGGPSSHSKIVIYGQPTLTGILKCHIADTPPMIRIEESMFVAWLRKQNLATGEVIKLLIRHHGAAKSRHILGGGTKNATIQMKVIELPLVGPFAPLLDDGSPLRHLGATRTLAQPVAGNQPKV